MEAGTGNLPRRVRRFGAREARAAARELTTQQSTPTPGSTGPTPSSLSAPLLPLMDRRLMKAATIGDDRSMKHLHQLHAQGMLLGTTPQGNTCLHISSAHGHKEFSMDAVELDASQLEAVNANGETPLLTAVTQGHTSLASLLIRCCRDRNLSAAISTQDKGGCNVLHHAIRSGHTELALELIAAAPSLSRAVNNDNESPMFIAAMRDFTDVCNKLLEIPDSAHSGAYGNNVLHAATTNDNSVIAKRIMETRPFLAREENMNTMTAGHVAAVHGKTDVLRTLFNMIGH